MSRSFAECRSFAEYWSTGEDPDAIRILVVDDDENMVELLVGVLGAFGYVVSGATTIQAALTACRNGRFDVAIVDVHLADGNGAILAADLRDTYDTRPILMSGHSDLDRLAARAGIELTVAKPFEIETVLDRLTRAVGWPFTEVTH